MIHNALFWRNYILHDIIPQVRALGKSFDDRILPAFQGIKEEAKRVRQEEWERLCKVSGEDTDPAGIAEAVQDAGIEHYMMMRDLKQGIINLFAAASYHLFEQQLLLIHRKELLSLAEENDKRLFKLEKVVEKLKVHGIEIKNFRAWPKLDELRLVANTVKHADGHSAAELKQRRPELFSPRDPIFQFGRQTAVHRQVFQPLFGQDFYVIPEELRHYLEAIAEFWEELANALEITSQESLT